MATREGATSPATIEQLEERVRGLQLLLAGAVLLILAISAVAIVLVTRELAAIRRDGQSGALVSGAQLFVDGISVRSDAGSSQTIVTPSGIYIQQSGVSDGQPSLRASLRGDKLSLYHHAEAGSGSVSLTAYPEQARLRLEQGRNATAMFAVSPDEAEMSLHVQGGLAQFMLAEARRDTGFRFFPIDDKTGSGAMLQLDGDHGPTLQLVKGDAAWQADPSTPR